MLSGCIMKTVGSLTIKDSKLNLFILLLILFSISTSITSGCAIHYFDKNNNIEHIWGFGHIAFKHQKTEDGLKSISYRIDITGVSLGKLEREYYLTIGWNARQQIEILDKNTQLCFSWPYGSFYNVRIGSNYPLFTNGCQSEYKTE